MLFSGENSISSSTMDVTHKIGYIHGFGFYLHDKTIDQGS